MRAEDHSLTHFYILATRMRWCTTHIEKHCKAKTERGGGEKEMDERKDACTYVYEIKRTSSLVRCLYIHTPLKKKKKGFLFFQLLGLSTFFSTCAGRILVPESFIGAWL